VYFVKHGLGVAKISISTGISG